MQKQGIEVTAITFLNHFGCDISDRSSCSKDPFAASVKFGFKVKLSHLSDNFLKIVINPKHGHGKNMNPCVDCRILMLREAKELMQMIGADFIITGEVVGQRPMSQRKDCFPLVDREADVQGLVLRPLSARHLKKTIPEEKGLVNRDALYGFSGRARRPQMALAKEFGLTEYPAPAGGCLLTDPIYSYRLRDLLTHNSTPDYRDINYLRVGRHFRLSSDCKIVVGRNHAENEVIKSLAGNDDPILRVTGHGSPFTVILGNVTDTAISIAASLCVRYSDGKNLPEVTVLMTMADEKEYLQSSPAGEEVIEKYRVAEKEKPANALTG
jgi:tRNA U34 2-thiouridine synthase MnmA/TrmU